MPLSISIFKGRKYFLLVIGGALLAFVLNLVYTLKLDPEVQFWSLAIKEKLSYSSRVEDEKRFVFVGGSSCAFSVDCEEFENQYGLAVLNMGIHAGAGRRLQLELGLQCLKKNDVLVLAFETGMWAESEPFKSYPLGAKLYVAVTDILQDPIGPELGYGTQVDFLDLRIGSRHFVTRLAKLAAGRPAYRYRTSDIKKGGYLVFDREWPGLAPAKGLGERRLSSQSKDFLIRLKGLATKRNFQVVISLPWQLVDEDLEDEQRARNKELVGELSEYFLVLSDPNYGVSSDKNLYSDTNYHLTHEGAKTRCEVLARELTKLD